MKELKENLLRIIKIIHYFNSTNIVRFVFNY